MSKTASSPDAEPDAPVGGGTPPPSSSRATFAGLVAAGILVALIALVHRESPLTLAGDAWLDVAVTEALVRPHESGGAPPENPLSAGEPLPRAWLVPLLASVPARAGLDALHALELVALASAAAFALALVALGRRLLGSRGAGLLALWLALAGAFAQGPLLALWRLRAWGAPREDVDVVHPIGRYMRVWDGYGEAGPLIGELLRVGARPFALAALAAWLLALCAWLGARGRAALVHGATLLVLAAAGTAASPTLAAPAMLSVALAYALLSDRRRAAFGALLVTAAGATVGGLTARAELARLTDALALHPPHEALVQLLRMGEAGGLLAVLAVVGWSRARGTARRAHTALVVAALLACVGCALLLLPARAENELFLAALVLLAVPASASALRAPGDGRRGLSPLRTLLVAGAFVPSFAVVVGAHLGRPPAPFEVVDGRVVRAPASSDDARLEAWIAAETARGAVLVVDPELADARLAAFTGRALFAGPADHPLVAAGDDAALRRWIASDLVTGRELGVEGEAYLASLGREVWIVVRGADAETLVRLAERHGEPALRTAGAALFRW